ncbi:alpha-hydroxy-acid oxidizing protein, partial [Rhizobium leguminosarum]|uniref:alpha-hydroxy-acid oxidizing protein n=1 Tax=Rhizobium leguminosarum TaxID=384 RepID=UPI001981608F
MKNVFSVEDFRIKAKNFLPRMVYDYLEGGSEREIGLARNVDAFRKWNFVPSDLPLNFHPAATRAPAVLNTPSGAVGAT